MSGHSKWHNIQATKSKADSARGKIFTKIGREIAVAVKFGGPDPANNARLRDAILKAKQNNMPNENINRSIKKASGELQNVNFEEITYEGYGAGGSALIVNCLTDNKNRTAGDVRHAFDKFGGNLGTTGSVSYLFENKGVLTVEKSEKMNEEMLLELCLEAEAEDVIDDGDVFEIVTEPSKFSAVKEFLEQKGVSFLSSGIMTAAQTLVKLSEAHEESLKKLLNMLEELDDVQTVFHNVEMDEEEEE